MAVQASTAPATYKLTPARVLKGRQPHSRWTHVHGPPGVGKSTFAAGAPDPIFLDVEQGTMNLDVTRFQFDGEGRTIPLDWNEVLGALRSLEEEQHPYKTVVIDTLDAVEALIWAHICLRDKQESIIAYGYGKGENYVAVDEWRRLVAHLERLRAKGLHVITLSHSIIKSFHNPEGQDWDRYVMKLHEKAGGLVYERANTVLFANFESFQKVDKKTRKVRGELTGARFAFTRRTGAYDAKNRDNLPESLALDWNEYWGLVQSHRSADPRELVAAIQEAAEKLGPELKAKTLELLARAGGDAVNLSKLHDWTKAKLVLAGKDDDA